MGIVKGDRKSISLASSLSGAIVTNTLYGSDYGIVADGVTDNTTAFNTFMAACKAGQYKGELPKGNIIFLSKPNDIDFGWDLGGKGLNSTVLVRKYNEVTSTNGLINLVANSSGARIHNMAIESASGQTGGCMISAISSASFAISGLVFENLWLSTFGSDTQTYTIYLDGSAKTTAPAGLRDASLKNVHVFGSTNYSAFLKSVIGLSWIGGGVYAAGGTNVLSGGVAIGGVASVKSQYVVIDIVVCNGLNLTNCYNVDITCPAIGSISGVSVNNDSTCTYTTIVGSLSGTLTTAWTNSFCNDIGNKMSFDGGKVRITNTGGGTTATNYLEIAGSISNNANLPGIQFTGGTTPTTYASIMTNNSGQGLTMRNGSSAGIPNYQQMFMFSNTTAASSYTDFSNNGTSVFKIFGSGSVVLGAQSALSTSATDGFAYMPSGAGTPTGVPSAITGKMPFYYDSTNNKIYIYNGAWKATAALT